MKDKDGKNKLMPIPKEWKFWTWNEYYRECERFAKTLISLDVPSFDVVNIMGFNSPEWFISNMGSILASCIAAGVYPTYQPPACHHQVEHSKSRVVVLEDNSQLKKYTGIASQLPLLKAIVVWMEAPDPKLVALFPASVKVYTWDQFMDAGSKVSDDALKARMDNVQAGHCSTLIYTSGTTSMPKAVMISHDNVTWTTGIMAERYITFDCNDRAASYLPLSHIAAQVADLHVPMRCGGCTYFCQPDAMKGSLKFSLIDIKPTYFFGVPRVWEKIQEGIVAIGRGNSPLKQKLGAWAKSVGAKHTEGLQFGKSGHALSNRISAYNRAIMLIFVAVYVYNQIKAGKVPQLAYFVSSVLATRIYMALWGVLTFLYLWFNHDSKLQYMLANALVFKNVKKALGLECSKANFTAAAPISAETLNYFGSLNIPVYEVFGQSECTGPHTVSSPSAWKIGYCGQPFYGTETKIDTKNSNELCYRGRHIFMGYMYDDKKTDETIDAEGFLHSGDVATFDSDVMKPRSVLGGPSGFMKITGRIKELLIGAGGENVAPVLIEDAMKEAMPALSNVMVVGDRQKYLTMLITLKTDPDKDGTPTNVLSKTSLATGPQASKATTTTEAQQCDHWKAYFDAGMKKANSKSISNAAVIQKWALIEKDFSMAEGELTPTMKLKRNVATEKNIKVIMGLYGTDFVDAKK